MPYRTDNPIADFDRYDAEQERQLRHYPKCAECRKRITDDYLFDINGDLFCEECAKNNFRRSTDDYIS